MHERSHLDRSASSSIFNEAGVKGALFASHVGGCKYRVTNHDKSCSSHRATTFEPTPFYELAYQIFGHPKPATTMWTQRASKCKLPIRERPGSSVGFDTSCWEEWELHL